MKMKILEKYEDAVMSLVSVINRVTYHISKWASPFRKMHRIEWGKGHVSYGYIPLIPIIHEHPKKYNHTFPINGRMYTLFFGKVYVSHRKNGPATVDSFGGELWRCHGVDTRDDGPSIITSRGRQTWIVDSKVVGVITHEGKRRNP